MASAIKNSLFPIRAQDTFVKMALMAFSLSAGDPNTSAPAPLWAASELIWPWEPTGILYVAAAHSKNGLESWPKTMGEICESVSANSFDLLIPICREKSNSNPASLTVNVGAYPLNRSYPLGQPFESFGAGWSSYRINPELAHTWSELPPTVKTELHYPVSPHSFIYFRLGLRRDLAAWHRDAFGLNLPLASEEVDLNEPSLGYFHVENENFAFTLGRFQVHWSPSPDFGLALSRAVPYHNAAEFALKTPHVHYRFLVSSLNPWLAGTPLGDSASTDYPFGSEEYRQRHYPDENQANNAHRRVYDERIKTLIAHRLEAFAGPVTVGITETEIIGGKVPDFRDGNPFAFFHNDFKDGYTNIGLSFDGSVRLPWGLRGYGELLLDDVIYAKTETKGSSASLSGTLVGLAHSFIAWGWSTTQSLQVVRTDPFLYSYLQPLNTMTSRQVLSSNYFGPEGGKGKDGVIDKFVVDYPLGYIRGGDAWDFWYRLDALRGRDLRLALTVGILAQGEVDFYTPYEAYYTGGHEAPSGPKRSVEREVRVRMDAQYRLGHGLEARGGIGWQGIDNENHISGADVQRGQVTVGVAWDFPDQ